MLTKTINTFKKKKSESLSQRVTQNHTTEKSFRGTNTNCTLIVKNTSYKKKFFMLPMQSKHARNFHSMMPSIVWCKVLYMICNMIVVLWAVIAIALSATTKDFKKCKKQSKEWKLFIHGRNSAIQHLNPTLCSRTIPHLNSIRHLSSTAQLHQELCVI
jgi:hypothetical protein